MSLYSQGSIRRRLPGLRDSVSTICSRRIGSGCVMQRMIDLSIVIPVFNGSTTVEGLVDEIHTVFSGRQFEVILVNDGSADDSEQVCLSIVKRHGTTVSFVHLSRNFAEHNA